MSYFWGPSQSIKCLDFLFGIYIGIAVASKFADPAGPQSVNFEGPQTILAAIRQRARLISTPVHKLGKKFLNDFPLVEVNNQSQHLYISPNEPTLLVNGSANLSHLIDAYIKTILFQNTIIMKWQHLPGKLFLRGGGSSIAIIEINIYMLSRSNWHIQHW